jgi:signal peptidase I
MGSDDHINSTSVGLELLDSDLDVQLTVGGESMYPFILPGNRITVSKVPFETLEIGNVIVFKRGAGWVAHRIVSVSSEGNFITKGDSCISFDEPVSNQEFVGRVVEVIQGENRLDLNSDSGNRKARRIANFSGVLKYPFHLANKVVRKFRRPS